MTLHAVGTYGSLPGPTVVLLHGWGSDEQDLAGLAPYLPDAMAWASVRAPLRHPSYGYAWYQLDSEESWANTAAIDEAADSLWQWVDQALGPDASVVPVGFSQGGLMASQLLRTRPNRVPAAAILSGYVLPTQLEADAVLSERRPPVFWGRGEWDLVIPGHAIAATEAILPAISTLEAREYPGMAHAVCEEELADLRAFLTRWLASRES